MNNLKELLSRIDNKGYKAYKSIQGSYNFNDFILNILHVQGDPYASPSLFEFEIDLNRFNISDNLFNNKISKIAFEDYILRFYYEQINNLVKNDKKHNNLYIKIEKPSNKILKRASSEISDQILKIRFYISLPAKGRKILGDEATYILCNLLPKIVLKIKALKYKNVKNHITVYENATLIRESLDNNNLIAFIANDAILARKSSIDESPMMGAAKFISPQNLEINLKLSNGFAIKGMGIRKGITLLTGGGFHGKSTLLNAISNGIYNHIPGDGREYVITNLDAVKIRAEDGRYIENLNISTFINNLPNNKNSKCFYTENASGSTSQAANILESIEVGAKLLLIDEDNAATNFMVRDELINALITKDKEPITPYIDKVRSLYEDYRVSTIMVIGGLGEYFKVADTILMLDNYKIFDVTERAKNIIKNHPIHDKQMFNYYHRKLNKNGCNQVFNRGRTKIRTRDDKTISIDKNIINLSAWEQIFETNQLNYIAHILKKIFTRNDLDKYSTEEILNMYNNRLENENITDLLENVSGNITEARKYEVYCAITRFRQSIIK